MGIYVETLIRAPMEALWARTQTLDLHTRWDLRFSEIDYLPRADERAPQRFRYTTRIGLGLAVSGEGETVGERDLADGGRTSALRFWSTHPLSLIGEGSGYWKYVPTPDGIRFLTGYDYRTRFGILGRVVDRVAFRPLIGWATAWSFDRLRLWLEEGIAPGRSMRQALVHGVARVGLALVFAWHGLVPKLLGPNPDEIALLRDAGLPAGLTGPAVAALGLAELLLAAALLLTWHRAWLPIACLALAVVATVGVALTSPRYLGAAFNPVTLDLAVALLAVIDLLTLADLPTAGRCLRRPPRGAP